MKIIVAGLTLAIGSLAFLLGVIHFGQQAQAADGTVWKNWGAAPYASSHEEGCRKAPLAIDGFKLMPKEVKEHFKSVLGTTCKGGKKDWLTPDMLLEEMWSGPDSKHKHEYLMSRATVAELPVLKSPDGRAYRKGAVAETAATLSWEFVYEGKTYVLSNPFACENFNWRYAPVPLLPPPVAKKCVELVFNAPVGGHVRWGIGTTADRPLLADECNAQKQDDGQWISWYGECDICPPAIDYIRETMGRTATVLQKFLYPVTATKQTLRFSTEIWANLVYICLEDAAGNQSCGVYMRRQDWQGRYRVELQDSLWVWDDANCPK